MLVIGGCRRDFVFIMNILSWIVRELENVSKRALVKSDIGTIRANWVALQETKFCIVDGYMVNQVCGQGKWAFAFSPLERSVGGILCR